MHRFLTAFWRPLVVLLLIVISLPLLFLWKIGPVADGLLILGILLGTYDLFLEAIGQMWRRQFGIDYIAILAVVTSVITGEYLVGAIIALMASGGVTLENYASAQAKGTLTALAKRLPQEVLTLQGDAHVKKSIHEVNIGDVVIVRHGEVVPVDGKLAGTTASLDESSLTGESYPVDKTAGDIIRAGTVNVGEMFQFVATTSETSSGYHHIIDMVSQAQVEKAPMVRLADQYSVYFTLITFVIAGIAYLHGHSLYAVLSVLVVATPCPLILATPIALLGGANKSAKSRVIIKKLASIEVLSRVNALVFDKTGTLTLGHPRVIDFTVHGRYEKERLLAISSSIEHNSLHPLAHAIVLYANEHKVPHFIVKDIKEVVGKGISGVIAGKTYSLVKITDHQSGDMNIGLYQGRTHVATFTLQDEVKEDARRILQKLQGMGFVLHLFTGDRKQVAEQLVSHLRLSLAIRSECSPEDKLNGIKQLQKSHVVAMVGDGINDAPALATADVGMVYGSYEQTAATEAADIVLFGVSIHAILQTILEAKQTIRIAMQSILWGIGLSIIAMIFAAWGLIPPVYGAILQELIDVAVIFNSLRAAR